MAGGSTAPTPAVDEVEVYVDGGLLIEGVDYQDMTVYAEITPGTHDIEVRESGAAGVLSGLTADFSAGRAYTVVLLEPAGGGNVDILIQMDEDTDADADGRIRVAHAAEGQGSLDVATASGTMLAENLGFREIEDYVSLPEGTYDLEVHAAGSQEVIVIFADVSVSDGMSNTFWIGGADAEPGGEGYEAVLSLDGRAGGGGTDTRAGIFGAAQAWVRAANWAQDVSSVDVSAGGLEFPGLVNAQVTGYRQLEARTHTVELRESHVPGVVDYFNHTFAAGAYYTLIGSGDFPAAEVRAVRDRETSGNLTMLRLVHESDDTPALDLVRTSNGTTMVGAIAYREHSDYVSIDPGNHDFIVRGTQDDQTYATLNDLEFSAGGSYSIYVFGSASADEIEGELVRDVE